MDSSFTACTTTSLQNRHCFTATKQNSNLLHVLLHCFSFAILPCWRCLKPKSPTAIAYNSRRTIVFKGHIEWQHWSFMATNVVSVYAVGWILTCKSALTALVSPITRVLYKVKRGTFSWCSIHHSRLLRSRHRFPSQVHTSIDLLHCFIAAGVHCWLRVV